MINSFSGNKAKSTTKNNTNKFLYKVEYISLILIEGNFAAIVVGHEVHHSTPVEHTMSVLPPPHHTHHRNIALTTSLLKSSHQHETDKKKRPSDIRCVVAEGQHNHTTAAEIIDLKVDWSVPS